MSKKLFILLFVIGIMFIIPLTSQICNNNISTISAQNPTVDGLFYGEPSGPGSSDFAQSTYTYIGNAPDGTGTYYAKIDGADLYIAVVVSNTVNDNVFGIKMEGGAGTGVDNAYLNSAGWTQTHTMQKLISSDNLTMTITSECGTWSWVMGYLHVDSNPIPGDPDPDPMGDWIWSCGTNDPNDGSVGTLPGGVLIAQETSGKWNMENTLWDVTLGGTRAIGGPQLAKIGEDWKSPFTDPNSILTGVGYPTWDATNLWEWRLVYEMKLDLGDCDPSTLDISINPAHNSPVKTTDVVIEDIYDWGDLPDTGDGTGVGNYETLGINGGPSHLLNVGGPYLGSTVDSETDGQPNEGANGDDNDGNDDHDGVNWISMDPENQLGLGSKAVFEVVAGTPGYLNAWVDWTGDGDFADAGENIHSDTDGQLTAGTHTITVNFTSEQLALIEQNSDLIYFHRWRFTANPSEATTPYGPALSGEVEDYVSLDLPLPVELTSFTTNATSHGVLCEWVTESEIENLGFLLERKAGGSWETISSYKSNSGLMGQGTTSSSTTYEFLDALVDANTTYTYRLGDVDYDGVVTYHAERTAKVEHAPNASIVQDFMVLPAYPNPFNPTTSIDYAIPENGLVKITIYDLTGSKVKTLVSKEQIAGWHQVQWNGENDIGVQMSAGIYLVSINTGQNIKTMKLLFVK